MSKIMFWNNLMKMKLKLQMIITTFFDNVALKLRRRLEMIEEDVVTNLE